jgi:hypothetical protein
MKEKTYFYALQYLNKKGDICRSCGVVSVHEKITGAYLTTRLDNFRTTGAKEVVFTAFNEV